jgi:hypothetical protein
MIDYWKTIYYITLQHSIQTSLFFSSILVSFCQSTGYPIYDKRVEEKINLYDDLTSLELDLIRESYNKQIWTNYFELIESYISQSEIYRKTLISSGYDIAKSDWFIEKNTLISSILLAFYGEILEQKNSNKLNLINLSTYYRRLIEDENTIIEKMIKETYGDFFKFI